MRCPVCKGTKSWTRTITVTRERLDRKPCTNHFCIAGKYADKWFRKFGERRRSHTIPHGIGDRLLCRHCLGSKCDRCYDTGFSLSKCRTCEGDGYVIIKKEEVESKDESVICLFCNEGLYDSKGTLGEILEEVLGDEAARVATGNKRSSG